MRLATFRKWNVEKAGLVTASGILPVTVLGSRAGFEPASELLPMIERGQIKPLTAWYNGGGRAEAEKLAEKEAIPYGEVVYGPLYRNPQRIFGIGLNYRDHAGDLGEQTPQVFPGSFYKPASCIAGPGDEIKIPALPEARKTTAEAELGVIIGKECRFIEEKEWLEYVAGYTTILDMTEESILRLNPRYLTIVKGFDTFFTFGPQFVTPDEIPDVLALEVATVHNGEVYAKNTVSNMTFTPSRLVALVSHMQGWRPGDVLSTGTPRAVHIVDGDTAECRITGPDDFSFAPLVNPVRDLKLRK